MQLLGDWTVIGKAETLVESSLFNQTLKEKEVRFGDGTSGLELHTKTFRNQLRNSTRCNCLKKHFQII